MNEADNQACPYKEAVDMIRKIINSTKHKDPINDILCECNRADRLTLTAQNAENSNCSSSPTRSNARPESDTTMKRYARKPTVITLTSLNFVLDGEIQRYQKPPLKGTCVSGLQFEKGFLIGLKTAKRLARALVNSKGV